MGTYVHKPNRGSLFRNDQPKGPKSPHMKGSGIVACPHCNQSHNTWLSAWQDPSGRIDVAFKAQNSDQQGNYPQSQGGYQQPPAPPPQGYQPPAGQGAPNDTYGVVLGQVQADGKQYGHSTNHFFTAWKRDKEAMKAQGWGMSKDNNGQWWVIKGPPQAPANPGEAPFAAGVPTGGDPGPQQPPAPQQQGMFPPTPEQNPAPAGPLCRTCGYPLTKPADIQNGIHEVCDLPFG